MPVLGNTRQIPDVISFLPLFLYPLSIFCFVMALVGRRANDMFSVSLALFCHIEGLVRSISWLFQCGVCVCVCLCSCVLCLSVVLYTCVLECI
jgi:hypothetical protein